MLNQLFTRPTIPGFAAGKPLLYPGDDSIMAVLGDVTPDTALPQLDINDVPASAAFILNHIRST